MVVSIHDKSRMILLGDIVVDVVVLVVGGPDRWTGNYSSG
jgi:hypothetical protein